MDNQTLPDTLPEPLYYGRRRNLLPWWMRFFVWLSIVFGIIVLPVLIFSIISTGNSHISLYGIETNQPTSYTGIFLTFLFLFKGIAAYALWWEDDMAIMLGMADAIIGIAICFFLMIAPFLLTQYHLSFKLRLELVLLIPYLLQLIKMKPEWDKRKKKSLKI